MFEYVVCVLLIHQNNINLIHSGSASVSVSVRCLVLVKIYGNSPRKLFIKIISNKDACALNSHLMRVMKPGAAINNLAS
jgi:hypothetical protein